MTNKTKDELQSMYLEETSLHTFGSTQVINFAMGIIYTMNGHEIPAKYYPLKSSKYLAKEWTELKEAPFWMICLWASTAMVQSHRKDLEVFGVTYDTWSHEKHLHKRQDVEATMSYFLVTNGAVVHHPSGDRCTQCGKRMNENTICAPCYKGLNRYDVGLEEWAKFKNLAVDYSSIWDKINE